MTITTPLQDRVRAATVTGEVPAQRTAPPAAPPTTTIPPQGPARGSAQTPADARRPEQEAAGAVQLTPAPAARPVPGPAGPTRVVPARAEPLRRRWPAVVGGLAAGLTLGTVGAVGAAFALSLTATVTTAPTPTVQRTGLSPNVSVPGRVLTAFGDGTWQVGVDIAPGTYTTRGTVRGTTCTHALRSARIGGKVAVAARSTTPGRATVVLTAADGWFATSGCATWQRIG